MMTIAKVMMTVAEIINEHSHSLQGVETEYIRTC